MPILDTLSFEDATDLVNRSFDSWKADPINNAMKESGIVVVSNVPMNTGKTRRHKERPVGEQYASHKTEGWVSTKTVVQQGYYKDTTSRSFSKAIDITIEMRELDKTGVYDAINFIGNALPAREDLNLSMFYSFGTATSYTDQDGQTVDISTWDGLAPFSTSHTLTGSSTTYRARVANNPAFSEGALELAEDVLRTNTYNNLGEQIACTPDTIVSTDYPPLVNSIKRLIQSTADISSPNNGVVNVYQGKYTHKVLPRIDMTAAASKDSAKKNIWSICDSKIWSLFHDIYKEAEIYSPLSTKWDGGQDINTLNWTYNSISMHDACWVTARGTVYSSWDGAA